MRNAELRDSVAPARYNVGVSRVFKSAFRIPQSALFLLALALRLWGLDSRGLWYDEIASLEAAGRGLPALLTDRFGWMLVQTPLHYLVVWLTSLPLDPTQSAVLVRLPSALAGALATLAVYGVGRELFGWSQGLLAALALAFSAVNIGYSQDLRPYAMVALFTVLSVYCLLVAERTRERKWWVWFMVATLVNLYLSYFALTLALPALVPFLTWAWYRVRKAGGWRYLMASLLVISVACVPVVLDLVSVPRTAPDWSEFTPALVGTQFNLALTQLTKIGIGGGIEVVVQWVFLLLALAGLAFGVREKRWQGIILCVSFLLVPSLLMAVFRTSNTVFQRYILFTLPFYLLLMANGLVGLWSLALRRQERAMRIVWAGLAVLLVAPFVYSAWVYFDPVQYRVFGSQPDYRGIARTVSSMGHSDDLVIVADEPGLGATVLGYYWGSNPPVPFFDARDPRLPAATGGSIYLVVSFFQNDAAFLDRLSIPGNGWLSTRRFERAVVLQAPTGEVRSALDHLTSLLEAENQEFQPVVTLRGSVSQLEGSVDAAASAYRDAGQYFDTGDEYLRTAEGYLQRGDIRKAWREALISKFMRPGNATLHEWLSARLHEEGQQESGAIEGQVARRLGGK